MDVLWAHMGAIGCIGLINQCIVPPMYMQAARSQNVPHPLHWQSCRTPALEGTQSFLKPPTAASGHETKVHGYTINSAYESVTNAL